MRFGAVAVLALTACGRVGFGFAGGTDAARADAIAEADADADADASDAAAVCPANALLCDSFEDGTLAMWTTSSVATAVILATNGRAHGGSYALEADVAPSMMGGDYALALK